MLVRPVVRWLGNASSGAVLRILLAFYPHFCPAVRPLSLGVMGFDSPLMNKPQCIMMKNHIVAKVSA